MRLALQQARDVHFLLIRSGRRRVHQEQGSRASSHCRWSSHGAYTSPKDHLTASLACFKIFKDPVAHTFKVMINHLRTRNMRSSGVAPDEIEHSSVAGSPQSDIEEGD